MKMSLMIALTFALAALTVMADAAQPAAKKPHRKFHRKPTGGLLLREAPKSYICVRDRQTAFKPEEIDAAISKIARGLTMAIRRIDADAKPDDCKVEIVLEDVLKAGGADRTILAAPEQGWATLATVWLAKDADTEDIRARRLHLELMRAVGMAMGVGVSMYQPCVMTSVRGIKDVDAIQLDTPGPEGINNFEKGAVTFGVDRLKLTTYRMACQEGWAPAPTNDIQKAIWKKVHELPSSPLKIKPETKKVAE